MAIGFNDLDDTVPADTAFIGEGAAKIREVKQALNTIFPNVKAEITKPDGFGTSGTQPSAADYSLLFTEVDGLVNPETTNSAIIPQGFIAMWNGDTNSTEAVTALNDKGWFLCVGGTAPNGYTIPNLRDKFVKGWTAQPVGAGGGGADGRTGKAVLTGTSTDWSVDKSYKLQDVNIPAHRHLLVHPVSGSTSDSIHPGENFITNSTQTIVSAAQAGSYDGEYNLAYFPSSPGIEPTAAKSSKYGNDDPTALDLGLSSADAAHEHLIENTEPAYYVVAYIVYAGVV